MFSSDQETALTEARRCQANIDDGMCPACGDPARSCDCGTGGSELVRSLLDCHNEGDHSRCAYSIGRIVTDERIYNAVRTIDQNGSRQGTYRCT